MMTQKERQTSCMTCTKRVGKRKTSRTGVQFARREDSDKKDARNVEKEPGTSRLVGCSKRYFVAHVKVWSTRRFSRLLVAWSSYTGCGCPTKKRRFRLLSCELNPKR